MKKIMFALLIVAMFLATTFSAIAYNSVDAAVAESLAMGEKREVQVGAIIYEVSLVATSGNSAKFQVNGEVTDLIEVGARDFLADNTEIGVIEVSGNKVQFYLDAVPNIPSLSYIGANAPVMKEGDTRTFNVMGKQYEVYAESIDRGGAKVSVNGEMYLMKNPKEAQAYGDTRYKLNEEAMISMGMIFYYQGELHCTIYVGEIVGTVYYPGEAPVVAEEIAISKPIESPVQPPVDEELTYDRCVSNYFEKADHHERIDRNYPLAKALREEGLRVCSERFGRPVPVPAERSGYDRCIRESMPAEDVFERMSPEQQAETKERVLSKCRHLQVAPETEVSPEYEQCRRELEEFKQMLVERYDKHGLEIPEELMRKYEELGDRCRVLSGEWRRPRPMPVEVPPEVISEERQIEMPEEAMIARRMEKPMPAEFRRECSGCMWEDSCLPIGTRLVKENGEQRPLFCSVHRQLEPQKQLGERCQNNYECVSNSCTNGMCQDISKKIEGIEKELKEQRSIMEKILGFFGKIFGG